MNIIKPTALYIFKKSEFYGTWLYINKKLNCCKVFFHYHEWDKSTILGILSKCEDQFWQSLWQICNRIWNRSCNVIIHSFERLICKHVFSLSIWNKKYMDIITMINPLLFSLILQDLYRYIYLLTWLYIWAYEVNENIFTFCISFLAITMFHIIINTENTCFVTEEKDFKNDMFQLSVCKVCYWH